MRSREECVADLIQECLRDSSVGVIVDGFGVLGVQQVVFKLQSQFDRLYVCNIGYSSVREPQGVVVSEKIEAAVAWRNTPDCAGRIVVFLRNDVPKSRSLEKFRRVRQRDVSKRIIAAAAMDVASNEPERAFWKALLKVCVRFPLQHIERFVQEVEGFRGKSTERIPKSLWALGLVCDNEVLSRTKDPAERLERNRQAIEDIGQLSEQSRRRMALVVGTYTGTIKKRFNAAYQSIMDFFKRGDLASLQSLELEDLETLIKSGKPLPKATKRNIDPDSESPPTSERPLRGKRLASSIATIVASQDKEQLDDLTEFSNGLVKLFKDPGDAPETFAIGSQIVEPTNTDEHWYLCRSIAHCCNENAWGGWFSTGSQSVREAFRNFVPDSFSPHDPQKPSIKGSIGFAELLARFDEQLRNKGELSECFSKLRDVRGRLVPYASVLMCYPWVPLATNKQLRKDVREYLKSYEELITLVAKYEADIHRADSQANRIAIAELLRFDVIYLHFGAEWRALLTPLHPFFLWRFQEVLQALDDKHTISTDQDREVLATAMESVPQVLHYLVSSPVPEGAKIRPLPLAGAFYELPTYENDTNRYLGADGVEFLATALNLWIKHAPYSRHQLRVALIDPPDIKSVLETLTDFLADEQSTSIILDVFQTRVHPSGTHFSSVDFAGADYQVTELLQKGRLVVRFPRLANVEDIEAQLASRPVHLCFAFDQGEFELDNAPRSKDLIVSPLVITYQYEYNMILKRGTISPSTDTEEQGIFSNFHFLIRRISDLGPDQIPRLQTGEPPNVAFLKSILAKGLAQWLVCADRSLSAYTLSSDHDVIQLLEKREGQREVGVWACPSERTFQAVNEILDNFPLEPDPDRVHQLFKQFAYVAATGWTTLLQSGTSTANRSVQDTMKGALGAVLAAAWYVRQYPDALVATLDSELARQWLVGREELRKRADLVGFRSDGSGSVIVEPIEVKSKAGDEVRIERPKQSNKRVLVGGAVDQLNEMLETIKPIFGFAERQRLFTEARREALKYQLHRECFRDVHSHEQRKGWYETLQDAFALPSPKVKILLQGLIIHVKFEEFGGLLRIRDSDRPLELIEIGAREIQKLLSDSHDENGDDGVGDGSDNDHGSRGAPAAQHANRSDESGSLAKSSRSEVAPNTSSKVAKKARQLDKGDWRERPEEIEELAKLFRRACQSFSISLGRCETSDAVVGPNVIRFYFQLGRGQRRAKLNDVLEDIGREMRRSGLVITPIEHSDMLALDVPRLERSTVQIATGLAQLPEVTRIEQLPIPIGVTPEGEHIIRELDRMPHMLVAGTTGAGKSVFLYGVLAALLTTHRSSESLRIILSSSKKEDFSFFKGLRHLEGRAVVDDAAKAIELLHGKVQKEIDLRKEQLDKAGCRDIVAFNIKHPEAALPPIVIIIDEFADLSDQLGLNRKAKTEFFTAIRKVAQAGRSRGVHLIICTQRPSAQLLPTDIRSLMNLRVAFRVIKREDSQMIIEESGADQLQMLGDLLMKDDHGLRRALGYFTDVDTLRKIINECRD
jgi:hypothetical protein